MAFGELMGFWGILLALPITAALKIASQHWLRGDFSLQRDEL
jgi:putative permease